MCRHAARVPRRSRAIRVRSGSVRAIAPLLVIAIGSLFGACGARTPLGDRTGADGGLGDDGDDGGTIGPNTDAGFSFRVRTLSVSWDHACAIVHGDRVACWGNNSLGLVGDVIPLNAPPTIVPNLTEVIEVATGQIVSCALKRDGSVWCWGNAVGTRAPKKIVVLPAARQLVVGSGTVCVVSRDERMVCTGVPLLEGAACARPTATASFDAAFGPNIDGVSEIAIGQRHACALRIDSSVWCWGCGEYGALGSLTAGNHAEPIVVPGLIASRIAAETEATCALSGTGPATSPCHLSAT